MKTKSLKQQIELRPATIKDFKFCYNLRNEDEVVKYCKRNRKLKREEYLGEFKEHLSEYKIIQDKDNLIGYLRISKENEISIAIVPEERNKGIGKTLLSKLKGTAIIMMDNKSSLYAFTNAGFKLRGFYLEK